MSRLCSHHQSQATMSEPTTPTPLPNPRKLANKQRRKAGRERHEERKMQLKAHEDDRFWRRIELSSVQQEKRRDSRARALMGWNVDNVRAFASHIRGADVVPDHDPDRDSDSESEEEAEVVEEEVLGPSLTEAGARSTTSGAMLLAMARPAKTGRSPLQITDGEAFEIVEIDGRLVALDEDGWEMLPDEHAEASHSYSDVVRGVVL
ncbi:hypothetical protein BJV78DRAFT_1199586 [Lactifluus subvellereus]|nr:hypothetical protein BJV78DRAFT_1199586 [Lactifluus subvellereus]